jgi:hypothetical protein
MINRIKIRLFAILFLGVGMSQAQQVSDYNVVWNSPSHNSAGSMPLGNGETGMNVWVEEGGSLLFYLSRTDAISEANRLMKLGRVRVSLTPNPFEKGKPFTQSLLLNEGVIEIKAGDDGEEAIIRLYLDASENAAYLTYESKQARYITVTAESWRRKPHVITRGESFSAWTLNPLPDSVRMEESADVFANAKNAVMCYHQNQDSQLFDLTMRHQDKLAYKDTFLDPITNRVFGISMTGERFAKTNDSTLTSKGAITKTSVKIATHSAQVQSLAEWEEQIKAIEKHSSAKTALINSQKRWSEFWKQSYVYIDIPDDKAFGHKLTQAYILQRYMAASSGRGHFPIKFNGSIFTADPQYTVESSNFSPDYRNWGNEFWWQNTRLPYYAMFASGDFDLMHPFFKFYLDRMPAFRTMASKYYGAKGIFIPETVSVFGTYSNGDYGWDRSGVTSNEVTNEYIRHIWVQGLELSKIMLDYYAYTGDSLFLVEKALPVIRDALLYFDSRFVTESGKMRIEPTQSLETYWFNVVNDLPCVAGLHYLTAELKHLPSKYLGEEDLYLFERLEKSLPSIPTQGGVEGDVFVPAQEYLNVKCNVENPELYIVFPFGLSNFTNELKKTGIRSYHRRVNNLNTGWGQDGQIAATLGLTDSLPDMLREKIGNTNPRHRFPAMWGPNYDWVPDQDHGSNLLLTLQYMLLQTYHGKSHLLPAWPKEWNVVFKLFTPNQTVVEGEYKNEILKFNEFKTNKK